METGRVLIISPHALFAEAITHLLQEEGVSVAGCVQTVDKALPLLGTENIETVIVDQESPHLGDADIVSQLLGNEGTQQVIFLTLSGNRMIVHHQERVENMTPDDLIKALRFSKDE